MCYIAKCCMGVDKAGVGMPGIGVCLCVCVVGKWQEI